MLSKCWNLKVPSRVLSPTNLAWNLNSSLNKCRWVCRPSRNQLFVSAISLFNGLLSNSVLCSFVDTKDACVRLSSIHTLFLNQFLPHCFVVSSILRTQCKTHGDPRCPPLYVRAVLVYFKWYMLLRNTSSQKSNERRFINEEHVTNTNFYPFESPCFRAPIRTEHFVTWLSSHVTC